MATIEKVFGNNVVTRFPESLDPTRLLHIYSPSREGVNIPESMDLAERAKREVTSWYENTFGVLFDKFNLGEKAEPVRQAFRENQSFLEAMRALNINPENAQKISLPWWVEPIAGETGCEVSDDAVYTRFAPMHSYEVQLARAGMPLKNVHGVGIDGIVLTGVPRSVIMGVRAGASYPNNYHVLAGGSLRATDKFKNGEETIYDIFVREELKPEMGDLQDKSITSIIPVARTLDVNNWNGDVTYVFKVQTDLSEEGAIDLWIRNPHRDKAEHSGLAFVPANTDAIRKFIEDSYMGKVANKQNRADNERYLLHTGALDLCAFAGINASELGKHYREGTW